MRKYIKEIWFLIWYVLMFILILSNGIKLEAVICMIIAGFCQTMDILLYKKRMYNEGDINND